MRRKAGHILRVIRGRKDLRPLWRPMSLAPVAKLVSGFQPSELLSTAHAKVLGSARKHLFSPVWNTATHAVQLITFFLGLVSSPFSDRVSCSSFPRSL